MKKGISLFLVLFFAGANGALYAQNSTEEAKEHYLRGDMYYQQGKYFEAQQEFEKALTLLENKSKDTEKAYKELTNKEQAKEPPARTNVEPKEKPKKN